ncbi:hypothetical protein P691DRAFT_808915 [Macrolepiota fuliginosa MF-IS2]|uniref:GTP binding protein n=1 Tax=Macrolepiota fuliginosa MF-IS2 TaxID=1400762 RepID=A0A9P6C788_9AGAR|nr:hypothetical protein P691DRAFT_808915 [Macrolepiota fuliginosa MF-IS2]
MTDIPALEQHLHDLCSQVAEHDNEMLWGQIESTSQALGNALRTKDGPVDNHALLGQTPLPQSVKLLLTTALHDTPLPSGLKATAVLELIRIAANFCIDNNENRSHLLEAGVIQVVLSLLEAYNDKVSLDGSQPAQLSTFELKLIRTALGALLNASLGYDEVKNRLNSLEAGQTVLRLVTRVYPVSAWTKVSEGGPEDIEEWDLRCTISSWGWRFVSELRSVKDEAAQIFNVDILPLLTPPLTTFLPPFEPADASFFSGTSTLASLVESDFDVLEDACTLIESLTLDVEDIRLALARGLFFPAEHSGVPCLSTILNFVELGDYPPTWRNSRVFDNTERARKEKEFGICKAALVKAIVEVTGEEKNDDILWDDAEDTKPGGPFVYRMVNWIKLYLEQAATLGDKPAHGLRDDLAIAAWLSLGNLSRRQSHATALLSPPYSLAPLLASPLFISPSTDLKLKHATLGFLKNVTQSAGLSQVIHQSLGDSGIISCLTESGIWDERADVMADVVQLNAIGIVKHLCNADVEHTFSLVIPAFNSSTPSGLEQIVALVKRTDSIPIKSEGSRVLVNVIRSLWAVEPPNQAPSQERQRNRETATRLVLTQESADALAMLLAGSGRYPVLINESILALTLLSMHYDGGQLVLKALNKPTASALPAPSSEPSASPTSDVSSPVVTSPIARSKLHVPRHALDMLIFVLRNVDNPANYPQEVRINACSLLLQLTKHTSEDDIAKVKDTVRSTLEKLVIRLQSATGKDEMLRNSIQKVLSAWA